MIYIEPSFALELGTPFALYFLMATLPRNAIIEDGSTFHVTWQCHNQDWLLQHDWAKKIYYDLLLKYKKKYRVEIYSYNFMSNHPHLTGHCEKLGLFSDFFRLVNSRFARMLNKRMKRRGQVVMDRFKSPRIDTDTDLLEVMIYQDLNPPRQCMVDHPKDYKWTSYHFYAFGKPDPLITPAPSYLILGLNDKERQLAYQAMVDEVLKNDWRVKKPYSSAHFIGNPDWVKAKMEHLAIIKKEKRLKAIEKRKKKFAAPGPPS